MSARRVVLAAALFLLAMPGAAHAATASISGSQVVVNAGAGESNNLYVSDVGPNIRIQDTGSGVTLSPGAGCSSGPSGSVNCPSAGITLVNVSMGDGNDDLISTSAEAVTVDGGADNDEITTGGAADTLNGGDGNDALDGGLGSDTLNGGADTLDPYWNGGDWILYQSRSASITADLAGNGGDGQAGENDTIGSDVEHLVGGSGNDTLTGNAGQNAFVGGGGADVMRGAEGKDWAIYWDHPAGVNVSLDGVANDGYAGENDNVESGIENIVGDSGPDTLTGDDGANGLYPMSGNDTMNGAGGDDEMYGSSGADVFNGGAGSDTATYVYTSSPVMVDLDGVADDGPASDNDNVMPDVERLVGGDGNDTLVGGAGDQVLDGGPGGDVMKGGDGNDTVTYESRTASVNVSLNGTADDGESGEGDDVGGDVETLLGGEAGDTLSGGDGDNTLDGGSGADVMNGGGGTDTVTYASRTGAVTADLTGDADDGETGENDTVGSDVETLMGGSAGDTLTGSGFADKLIGGAGDDTLNGAHGADELDAGDGVDTVLARDGAIDSIRCGSEVDSVTADDNDDLASDCEGDADADAVTTAADAVKLTAKKLRMNGRGVVAVPLRCQVLDGICKGTVVLTAKRPKTRKNRAESSRRSRPRKRAVIGRASFKVEAGDTVKVKVKVSHNGRRRVLRKRKLRCRATIKMVAEDGTKSTVQKALTLLAPNAKETGR